MAPDTPEALRQQVYVTLRERAMWLMNDFEIVEHENGVDYLLRIDYTYSGKRIRSEIALRADRVGTASIVDAVRALVTAATRWRDRVDATDRAKNSIKTNR